MDVGHFFRITEKFNKAFKHKLLDTVREFCDEPSFISNGRLLSSDFCGGTGYHTPHSNEVIVGLVQRKKDVVEIQLQQGPLIITTATVDFEEDETCTLTLQTNPLSMYDVYPLHAYKHEPNDFFQKNGYGRLSLYFSLLYAITSGMTMSILCENSITAYILLVLFRSESVLESDVQTNYEQYLHKLSQHEKTHGTLKDFEDFSRLYAVLVPVHGDLTYEIHATANNSAVVTRAVEKWINDRIERVSFADFMATYIKGPMLLDYQQLPRLQEDYPQFSFKSVIARINEDFDVDSY